MQEQSKIENEYRQAVDLYPQNQHFHARWIGYLIMEGRTNEAKSAFAHAIETFHDVIESKSKYVFLSIHFWVAALLIRRAQLDFARQVLDRVPADVRRENRGFIALDEKLAAMEEARRGRGVFPLFVPASQHWRKSPHLDFPPQVEGRGLLTWNPARVEAVSEHGIALIVGKPPERGSQPTYGMVTLPIARFDAATLDERAKEMRQGRFLELAFYGSEGILKIRTHPQSEWEDPDLPINAHATGEFDRQNQKENQK